jgi:hypothetical protein
MLLGVLGVRKGRHLMGAFIYGGMLIAGLGFFMLIVSQANAVLEENDRRYRDEWERQQKNSRRLLK